MKGDFVPVQDPRERLQLVKQGAKNAASATVWTPNQERLFKTHLSGMTDEDQGFYIWIPGEFKPEELRNEIVSKNLFQWFFNISLSNSNIFFKSRFQLMDSAGMKFLTPTEIYKVQRRKDFRFTIPDGLTLKVEFSDPLNPTKLINRKVVDISASGLSFQTPSEEKALFKKGAALTGIRFRLGSDDLFCGGEVMHTREFEPGYRRQGLKVGILFTEILPRDSEKIASFVLRETRKYVSKIL